MAVNKNAQIRYQVLDRCFSNKFKKYFFEDLIVECETKLSEHYAEIVSMSRRQIYDDIDFMKSEAGYDAPIISIKDGKRTYYRYEDENFSIAKRPLNSQEIEYLKQALFTLNRMNNTKGFEWTNSLQTKLYSELDLGKNNTKIIDFEENEFLKGLHFLYPLYQFICNQQSLEISYKSFQNSEVKKYILSPHYLKQHNNRWFLLSTGHGHQKVFTLAIDRIVSVEISKETYISTQMDFSEYFREIIGITNYQENELETVVIQVETNIIPYLESKPLHISQKIEDNLLSLKLKLNFELEGLILSYGENMKVLQPNSLAQKLKERIKKMQKN